MPVTDERRQSLTFIERFIAKHYMKQPPPVRTVTFVVFVGLFAYAFIRIISGNVVLTGTIFETDENNRHPPAKNYDVRSRVGDRLVGTNSKGEYHLIVSPTEALGLIAVGKLELTITDKEGFLLGKHNVPVNRLSMLIDELFLDAVPKTAAHPLISPFVAVAYAATQGNRLFVRELTVKNNVSRVTLKCTQGCTSAAQPLRAARSGGTEAGPIPVSSGKSIYYDFDYYFELPPGADGLIFSVSPESKGWFGRDEQFVLGRAPARFLDVGDESQFSGTAGSRAVLLLLSPDDVVVYPKEDLAPKMKSLKDGLKRAGLGYVEQRPPLGEGAETNALFVGSDVSVKNAQAALRVLQTIDVPIKSIRKRTLRSGNQHQLQLGGASALNRAPRLSPQTMTRLLSARSDRDFWEIAQSSEPR